MWTRLSPKPVMACLCRACLIHLTRLVAASWDLLHYSSTAGESQLRPSDENVAHLSSVTRRTKAEARWSHAWLEGGAAKSQVCLRCNDELRVVGNSWCHVLRVDQDFEQIPWNSHLPNLSEKKKCHGRTSCIYSHAQTERECMEKRKLSPPCRTSWMPCSNMCRFYVKFHIHTVMLSSKSRLNDMKTHFNENLRSWINNASVHGPRTT